MFKSLKLQEFPQDSKAKTKINNFRDLCTLAEDGLIRRTINRYGRATRSVIVAPQDMQEEILKAAHCTIWGGHAGIWKTNERILRAILVAHSNERHTRICNLMQNLPENQIYARKTSTFT